MRTVFRILALVIHFMFQSKTLTIVTNERFTRLSDGTVLGRTKCTSAEYWGRYLYAFDKVKVVARCAEDQDTEDGFPVICNTGVEFVALPNFVGLTQFPAKIYATYKILRNTLAETDSLVLRVPSIVSTMAWLIAKRKPYAVEVLGNPIDGLAKDSFKHPLQPIIQPLMVGLLRRQCKGAQVASYVTREALQKDFPASKTDQMFGCSEVIVDDILVHAPRSKPVNENGPILINIGRFDQLHKGPDTLIKCLAALVDKGVDAQVVFVGEGRYIKQMNDLARELEVSARVRFEGHVSNRSKLCELLDESDIFVMPSRHEGLPRALVEAQARSLPVVASNVGGIPELLDNKWLCHPEQPSEFASRVAELFADEAVYAAASTAALLKARTFTNKALDDTRRSYYAALTAVESGRELLAG